MCVSGAEGLLQFGLPHGVAPGLACGVPEPDPARVVAWSRGREGARSAVFLGSNAVWLQSTQIGKAIIYVLFGALIHNIS